MGYKILTKCPVCNSKLKVTKLRCSCCNTIIENEFELSKFAYLSAEQLEFVEVFLRSRGNIKDVEKEMGISYPTVRSKLDDVILALGYSLNKKPKISNKEVLDMLEKGEISPEAALKAIKEGELLE
ncbi:DUF2089 family protein [Clostridium bovifaecis]|uniref:DUF2089 family protein n=1 Tax=Clostridium bovifaecis TaxID=2184719 RepID=A0A6I6F1M5_9CLOT|nr:DUF2089 family protein [Clostridium bovifaecis]